MSISTVFDTIKTGLENVLHDLGELVPSQLLGEENFQNPGPMPTIVWVPRGAAKITPIAGPRAPTKRSLTLAEARGRIEDPNQVARRDEFINIYVRNVDFRSTEKLLNHLVATMRVALTGFSFRPMSTEWSIAWPVPTNEPTGEIVTGTCCIFGCTVAVPFTFEDQPVAKYPIGLTVDGQIVHSLT
jgi:hypothetical protein